MSDYSRTFQMACIPGPGAAAAMTRGPGGAPVLVVYLDPINITLHSEASATGTESLAKFCRELAREAAKLAAEIDSDGEPVSPERGPRHRLVTGDDGDLGAGY